jgi:hypothetical protein
MTAVCRQDLWFCLTDLSPPTPTLGGTGALFGISHLAYPPRILLLVVWVVLVVLGVCVPVAAVFAFALLRCRLHCLRKMGLTLLLVTAAVCIIHIIPDPTLDMKQAQRSLLVLFYFYFYFILFFLHREHLVHPSVVILCRQHKRKCECESIYFTE